MTLKFSFPSTAGAMEPTKRGNFFHIESVRPMTEEGAYFSVSQYSTYAIARLGCTALFE